MPLTVEQIARVCHEANAALCFVTETEPSLPWNLSEESAIAGVQFAFDNPTATPEDQHNAWCDAKLKSGWKYGPEKNVDRKRHPCLRPYEELPEYQRAKDHLFQGIVKALS